MMIDSIKTLRFSLILASLCLARGSVVASYNDVICEEANHEADLILEQSNIQMRKDGQHRLPVDWFGFEREVSLYAFGWKLPVSIVMKVANGSLIGMDTMKRSGNVFDCTSSAGRTLKGYFEYGPELALSYTLAEARLFYHQVLGEFIFKPKLRMFFVMHNETEDCRLETVKEARPEARTGQNEYLFESTSKCWMSWLVGKLLVLGLQIRNETPMMSQVVLWSQGEVFKYLTDVWCQSK